jgi:hypothetical protein
MVRLAYALFGGGIVIAAIGLANSGFKEFKTHQQVQFTKVLFRCGLIAMVIGTVLGFYELY